MAAGRDTRDAAVARILDHGALLGGKARALAGKQIHLGIGLAVHDVLAASHSLKLVKETERLKVALGGNVARRRRKAHVIARSQKLVQALGSAGLKLQLGLDHLVANLLVADINRLGGLVATVALLENAHDIYQRTADKLMNQRVINREPQLGSARLPRLNTQSLGVDQRSIHIKNDSLDHFGPPIGLHCRYSTALYELVYNVYTYCTFVT